MVFATRFLLDGVVMGCLWLLLLQLAVLFSHFTSAAKTAGATYVERGDHQLAMGHVAAESFANSGHIHVLRRGLHSNEVDEAARVAGLERRIVTVVSGFSTALALVRETDMIATVPDRHTLGLRKGLHSFELPFGIAPFMISMLWHPRMDGDQAHRWRRAQVRAVCAGQDAVGT